MRIGRHGQAEPSWISPVRAALGLIAFCGLGGGVGTSTVAGLLARSLARSASRPVLLCDCGGPAASLASDAGAIAPFNLASASAGLAAGSLGGELFCELQDGLRLLARAPGFESNWDRDGLTRLLADATDAHAATVVDCGTLQQPSELAVARSADTIVWVTEASGRGVQRAATRFAGHRELKPAREILVGRGSPAGASGRELCSLAEALALPLVLMPFDSEVWDEPALVLAHCSGAIHALQEAL